MGQILPQRLPGTGAPDADRLKARSHLHGLAAVLLFWLLALAATVPLAAQPVEPQRWDAGTAAELVAYGETLGSHGLDPADYALDPLRQALASGDAAALERQASLTFGLIARDLASGHIRPGDRGRVYLASDTLTPERVAVLIDLAIAHKRTALVLESLAPQHAQYASLRRALAELPANGAEEQRRQLRLNLDRWRWLPRELGERHLLVNIPEYRLRLFEDGEEISAHNVIVGKGSTPTPQFNTIVKGVIFNPTWTVPQSIIAESVGRLVRTQPGTARARGYTWTSNGGRLQVVQQPGPGNALGQIKLDMPNPLTIFIHDTPSKNLFEREVRTFSHGCIRTQAPFDLAAVLLAGQGWDRARIDGVVGGRKTTRVPLDREMPAYVVYITAVAQPDGTVAYLADPYSRDKPLFPKL